MKHLLLATAIAGLPSLAMATPTPSITIGVGAVPAVVSGPTTGGLAGFIGIVGGIGYNVTATGSPAVDQPIFDTTAVTLTATGASTATVWITEQNLSSPIGINTFKSGFTSNTWTPAANVTSVVETSFIDTSNGLFGGTQLSTATFTAETQSVSDFASTPFLASPFSETVMYVVTFSGSAIANDTIDLAAVVPEPASLALFGVGLLGLGVVGKRKRSV